MLKLLKYLIFCLVIHGCTADGCMPTQEPMPPAGQYNSSIYFDGGGFCSNEKSDFDLDIKVFAPGNNGLTTIAWTNKEPGATDAKIVKTDPSIGFSRFKINGNDNNNVNPLQIRVPTSGPFNIQVTMTSKSCLKCCVCFGKGGKAILTGSSMETSNSGNPIRIEMQHDPLSGCPFADCCQ